MGSSFQLIFYGYCGSNIEDAIAIDNIVLETQDISTTEMVTTTTTTPTTTTPTTTTPTTTTPTTTTPTTTTPTTTPQSPVLRTVIFIFKVTQVGQDMFIRGGIDDTIVRPICQDDVNAETSACAVSIQVKTNC
jgi:hypothetical protein